MTRRASEFSAYEPQVGRDPVEGLEVRCALAEDARAVARIAGLREGLDPVQLQPRVQRDLEAIERGADRQLCCVALVDGAVVGYGKARWIEPGRSEAARNAPSSWYLSGLVVSPESRRRGVGEALTAHRLTRLAALGVPEVHYFANAANRATIDLHERLGFVQITRDFAFPGVTFSRGGVGVLFRKVLTPP